MGKFVREVAPPPHTHTHTHTQTDMNLQSALQSAYKETLAEYLLSTNCNKISKCPILFEHKNTVI